MVLKLTMVMEPFFRDRVFFQGLPDTTILDCMTSHATQYSSTQESWEEAARDILQHPCEFSMVLSGAMA